MLKIGQICYWIALVWFVVGVAGCLSLFSCGPAMPPCDTLGEWRCDDNEVHMCTSEQWSFRFDCSKIGLEDGGISKQLCVENNGLAECVL